MAKLDTPFPPHHRRCLFGSTILDPSVIAGILEGNGVVGVRPHRSSSGAISYRPRISLAARDDDPTPFSIQRSIEAHTGRRFGSVAHDDRRGRNVWRVERRREVLGLTEWVLLRVRLDTELSGAFAKARDHAANLLDEESAADGELSHEESASSWSVENLLGVAVGLIATNGYFAIRAQRGGYVPFFEVAKHASSRPLLERLREATGLGTVEVVSRQVTSPQVGWVVRRRRDAEGLRLLLQRCPLPPTSPKNLQLAVWTRAWLAKEAGEQRELEELAGSLRRVKRRAGPRLLCSCKPPPPEAREHMPG